MLIASQNDGCTGAVVVGGDVMLLLLLQRSSVEVAVVGGGGCGNDGVSTTCNASRQCPTLARLNGLMRFYCRCTNASVFWMRT